MPSAGHAGSFAAMGTVMTVRAHGGPDPLPACRALVEQLEDLLSRFRTHSDVARLNAANGTWTAVHPHTDAVLARAVACAEATDGAYDPVLGALVELWSVRTRMIRDLPPAEPADVERALGRCGWHLLERDAGGRYRLAPDARVDLGGIAKGYAADRVRDLCADLGARGALVSFGSSSVATLGTRPDGRAWRVGLRDVHGGPAEHVASVTLTGSLSTSGDYEQGLVTEGCRVHHVLDPRTGRPSDSGVRAATVLAADGAAAEAWSTAMLVRGAAWAFAACARTGVEAVLLTEDAVLVSPGLRDVVRRSRRTGRSQPSSAAT